MKSYWTSLCLLVLGGVFGLHHFYLGRLRHGIFNLFTFGGTACGLVHDLFRLRFYVNWANFDKNFKEEYVAIIRDNPNPSLGFGRGIAMVIAAQMFSNLVQLAIPADLLHNWMVTVLTMVLVPSAIAASIWYIGCIGETQSAFIPILRVALYTSPLYHFIHAQLITVMLCIYNFRSGWTYRLRPDNSASVPYTVLYVLTFLAVFLLLCSSMVMFNCAIEGDETQGKIKCRDALRHFFNSPLWQNIVDSLRKIREAFLEGGFSKITETLIVLMDPTGEQHAMHVLGVSNGANKNDIRRAYRNLSRKFHPDKNKFRGQEERAEFELRFREVQEAFETLQLRKGKRETVGPDLS
ncbi:dnaJsubfamily C member 22-like [Tropilaelaps mercedesae]|uniref:DnaJ homolog subfamily C member 22 n=1 Tax=Tropilaelaps mercedesae TaxID=418985 RepID=A0A1V9XQS1_9ACAR|nr:dnaJsubfamily C member 22-like [Tropilaelaps mercedesae]